MQYHQSSQNPQYTKQSMLDRAHSTIMSHFIPHTISKHGKNISQSGRKQQPGKTNDKQGNGEDESTGKEVKKEAYANRKKMINKP